MCFSRGQRLGASPLPFLYGKKSFSIQYQVFWRRPRTEKWPLILLAAQMVELAGKCGKLVGNDCLEYCEAHREFPKRNADLQDRSWAVLLAQARLLHYSITRLHMREMR
jgi:hypothetical protein